MSEKLTENGENALGIKPQPGEFLLAQHSAPGWLSCLSLLISGVGVGILVGLSVSPTVGTVVATLVTAAAGLLVVSKAFPLIQPKKSDISKESNWNDGTVRLAVLVIGLVIGSLNGIFMRTHNVLGVTASADGRENGDKAVDQKVPATSQSTVLTVLFANSFDTCRSRVPEYSDAELRQGLAAVNERWDAFLRNATNISRKQLVAIFQSVACGTLPLSAQEVGAFDDKNLPTKVIPPGLVDLMQSLDRDEDRQLLSDIVHKVYGPK